MQRQKAHLRSSNTIRTTEQIVTSLLPRMHLKESKGWTKTFPLLNNINKCNMRVLLSNSLLTSSNEAKSHNKSTFTSTTRIINSLSIMAINKALLLTMDRSILIRWTKVPLQNLNLAQERIVPLQTGITKSIGSLAPHLLSLSNSIRDSPRIIPTVVLN